MSCKCAHWVHRIDRWMMGRLWQTFKNPWASFNPADIKMISLQMFGRCLLNIPHFIFQFVFLNCSLVLCKNLFCKCRKARPEMTGIMLKWPRSKNVTKKQILHCFWWRATFFTSSRFKIFSHHKGRKGRRQQTADKRTQMQSLHFFLEDVKISVFKKIKSLTLNAERCLKCRHCSVSEKKDTRWEIFATDFGVTSKPWL